MARQRVFVASVTDHVTPVFFSGADEVVAEAFEESACQGEPGSGSGLGSEEFGAAQRGGGEPLVGGDNRRRKDIGATEGGHA